MSADGGHSAMRDRALADSERLSASVRFRAVTGRPSRQLPRLECVRNGTHAPATSSIFIRSPRRRGSYGVYVCAPPGRRTVNTEPLPGSLVTVTSPPIMRASLRAMASPSPVPPKRCAVVASAWVNSSNSFACCSGVMPMPVSETDSSIQSRPSATLRACSLTSPSLVNLQALLNRLSRICRSRMGSTVRAPRFSWASSNQAVLVLLGKLARGADHLVDQRCELHGLRIELKLAGFDLRQVEHLIDEAKQVSSGAVHALQRFLRLFRTEARCVGDHHLGQAR